MKKIVFCLLCLASASFAADVASGAVGAAVDIASAGIDAASGVA